VGGEGGGCGGGLTGESDPIPKKLQYRNPAKSGSEAHNRDGIVTVVRSKFTCGLTFESFYRPACR